MAEVEFKREKFKKLVHYVCSKVEDPSALGSTKLNKILCISDRIAYEVYGEPITGAKYIKRQYGPVPAAILPILGELQSDGSLAIKREHPALMQPDKFIALTEPDISGFAPQEVSLIDSIIQRVCFGHTARSISEATHDEIWKLAQIGEEIPYYTVYSARVGEVTETDVEWALSQINDIANAANH